jgi:acyl-coenzyme A synthetase/AMP-(fatty) acid ligase
VATALKKRLREYVPDYMVPKVITVVDRIPMTGNGKADRSALLASLRPSAEPVEGR